MSPPDLERRESVQPPAATVTAQIATAGRERTYMIGLHGALGSGLQFEREEGMLGPRPAQPPLARPWGGPRVAGLTTGAMALRDSPGRHPSGRPDYEHEAIETIADGGRDLSRELHRRCPDATNQPDLRFHLLESRSKRRGSPRARNRYTSSAPGRCRPITRITGLRRNNRE
ncbi:MAG: hypothetical protein J2P45_18580 [Candidatus Dormibacteraeota bacterium]|nr:hypothetical protein [Candidatus Dormibacteraeota bacterium]